MARVLQRVHNKGDLAGNMSKWLSKILTDAYAYGKTIEGNGALIRIEAPWANARPG